MNVRLGVMAFTLGIASAGCSLLFVHGPPDHPRGAGVVNCSTSKVAPVLDSIFTGLEVTRVGLDLAASDNAFASAPLNKGADIAVGLALAGLFFGST